MLLSFFQMGLQNSLTPIPYRLANFAEPQNSKAEHKKIRRTRVLP